MVLPNQAATRRSVLLGWGEEVVWKGIDGDDWGWGWRGRGSIMKQH